jgi:hypothetical protein
VWTSDLPNIIRRRKSLARLLVAIAAGIAGAALVAAITRDPGPGLDPDSASYIGAARSLASGRGYRIPITTWASPDSTAPLAHFPAGYPTAIAIPMWLGTAPLQSARLVNATAAFVELALAAWLVAIAAGELAALVLATALLVMPAFVEAHIPVLSEPLFLACFLATLAALHAAAVARSERERLAWSFGSGCAAAAALMTRYVGISACGAATLWGALLPGTPRDRLRRAAAATMPWLVLSIAWVVRTRHAGGPSAIRSIAPYGGIGDTLREGVATVVEWLVPLSPDDTLPGRRWIALAVLVLLLLAMVRGARLAHKTTIRRGGSGDDPVLLVAGASLLGLAYAAVLIASRLLADPNIPFDERLLLPLFVLGVIVAATTIRYWWRAARIVPRVVCAALVLAWLVASYHVSSDDVDWATENGYDLAGDPWRSSALIAWARANAAAHVLYSNWPTAVVLQLGRPSHETPVTSDTTVLEQFAAAVRDRQGIVLAFDIAAPDMIGPDALLRAPGLRLVARLADGSVFTATP